MDTQDRDLMSAPESELLHEVARLREENARLKNENRVLRGGASDLPYCSCGHRLDRHVLGGLHCKAATCTCERFEHEAPPKATHWEVIYRG
jgi:hypothetical protein